MKRLPIILLLFLISFGFSNLNAQTIVVDTVINNIKIGQEFSEGKSTEISTSTIMIDEGGKFNQQSASSALKKTTQNLINKLIL